MKEIDANKKAWSLLSKDHYEYFRNILEGNESTLSNVIENEIGDVVNKSIIHLQCNTGADTISLARKGAKVTGVDLASENIFYARKMANELKIENINFIESDINNLDIIHKEKYDIVFTTEGVLCWIQDIKKWGETIKKLLKDNGMLYLFDTHPFMFAVKYDKLNLQYSYFNKEPIFKQAIGGYASESKMEGNYSWTHTIGDVINSLADEGLTIEKFNEYDFLFHRLRGMEKIEDKKYYYPSFKNKIPLSFSLKARLKV
jgi:ubiquinone/menaquinone biosynthesis C-methylase UbiE